MNHLPGPRTIAFKWRELLMFLLMVLFLIAFILPGSVGASNDAGEQMVFQTPDDAVKALIDACKNNDKKALISIFGSKYKDFIGTSDEALDKENRLKFYTMAEEKKLLEKSGEGTMTLTVGCSNWTFPIPLIKDKNGWRYDSEAGKDEIINRRVGEDELQAITACQAYVAGQREYFTIDRNGDKVQEYARQLMSSPGKKDGLYWPVDQDSGEELSPLGPLMAQSQQNMKERKKGDPYYGYYYRILTRQGSNVPGGAHDYMINGYMIAGYALIAWPAKYGSSGVMTFMVNQQGEIYEKDLGPNTSDIASSISIYNPDSSWKSVRESLARLTKAKK